MTLSALHTDLYQLTMLAGYFGKEMHEKPAAFELFFREAPFQGGFAIFAGLQPALDYLAELHFTDDELEYIEQLRIFEKDFIRFLKDFKFSGNVSAPPEGTVVFPNEPLLTVEGTLAETQFVETALLNIINFQTLAATKAARICLAAGESEVIEFGLRRAQGPDGGLGLARAAAIGGVCSTSNVLAGKEFNLPLRGTHAHSWVMAFEDELSAFRAYASQFPDSCILLVDTYDTLTSGLPNAVTIARELRERGHELKGVRLDSGDIAALSRSAREMFDEAGFPDVKVVASNDLDEARIREIKRHGGLVDIYGVGTRLATCAGKGGGALGGVYKLVCLDDKPRLKTTSDPDKGTLPGLKQVWRILSKDGAFLADLLCLAGEAEPDIEQLTSIYDLPPDCRIEHIRTTVMQGGHQQTAREPLTDLGVRSAGQLAFLHEALKQPATERQYPVYISATLKSLQEKLAQERLAAP